MHFKPADVKEARHMHMPAEAVRVSAKCLLSPRSRGYAAFRPLAAQQERCPYGLLVCAERRGAPIRVAAVVFWWCNVPGRPGSQPLLCECTVADSQRFLAASSMAAASGMSASVRSTSEVHT